MFIARENELKIIADTLKKPNQAILIYGNRRVGKTTLAQEAMKRSNLPYISFECTKTSLLDNLNNFINLLKSFIEIPDYINFISFIDLFKYLNSFNKRLIIHIDEFPYLYTYEDKEKIDSIFQNIIDNYSNNINLIISGSHIGLMKDLTVKSNPLFGRFHATIDLKELDYLDASKFYPNLSNYDKVAFYAVFGGSPFVLSNLDYSKSLKENIINTILNESNIINSFISDGYTSDVQSKNYATSVFYTLANSKLKYSKLEEKLKQKNNGLLNKQLKVLIDMNFINKNYPINKANDSKKVTYQITNNLLRFFYTYVYGKANTIKTLSKELFFSTYIEKSLDTFISFRFEGICLSFISKLIQNKTIKDVLDLGTYYYDDAINKKNGEFDIAIKYDDHYDIIEVKYFKDKVNNDVIDNEIKQIKDIKELDIKDYGFISINGFKTKRSDLKYLYDGNDIYSLN